MPSRGKGSIAVEWLAEKLLRQRIDHHVARAGVEGDHLIRRGAGRNRGQVGDAADVLQDASALCDRANST